MIIYDAFYLLDTSRIIEYFDSQYNQPLKFEKGVLCIPPAVNQFQKDFVWAEIYCEPERELFCCELCNDDEESRLYGKPLLGHGAIYGNIEVEYFVPSPGFFSERLVSEKFCNALLQTSFQGYSIFPYNIYSLALYTDTDILPLKIFGLDFRGKTHNILKQREDAQKYPSYCVKCHWGPRICPKCLRFTFKCPVCGEENFEYTIPKPIQEHEREAITITYVQKKETFISLLCEEWDGSDFLEGHIVTGRVAKWLVENQYGPLFLLPYPADISCCSKEQMERINEVRYLP
jgi:hypothetical protein